MREQNQLHNLKKLIGTRQPEQNKIACTERESEECDS